MAEKVKNVKLTQDDSEDNLCKADFLRAKDSLENLLINREMVVSNELSTSKSASMPFRKNETTDQIKNDPPLKNYKNSSAHSISKVLAWDPWDKLGKRSKRENKVNKVSFYMRPNKCSLRHSIPLNASAICIAFVPFLRFLCCIPFIDTSTPICFFLS